MLPKEHNQQYQKLSQLLNQLQKNVAEKELGKILAINQELQQLLEIQIISLDNSELDPSIASHIQSYLTEIHKQFRLLNVDVSFLQASRNPQTTQKRLANISDRLDTLKGYCVTILGQN
ncbi:MAG: heterocyst frequency control protein PatD [Okeania sp. SIO3I5]|uniref:heterocyst frequency control protein PatD n=1 Tax=Okeania sp. SIO3I5 TaxID=2607805 RepID=UPI0013BE2DE7|nr:heterocyst frequency control protein PatD [Okeania sp. SIO3I5]NEQ34917.1 heterocyst frequency control protein PatD [Okeania sp. SIO3I5]